MRASAYGASAIVRDLYLPASEVPIEWIERRDSTRRTTTFCAFVNHAGAHGRAEREVSGMDLLSRAGELTAASFAGYLRPILNELADAAVRAWRYDLWRGWGDALLAGEV